MTETEELPAILREESPIPAPRALPSIVVEAGGQAGVGLLEACLRRLYPEPDLGGLLTILTGIVGAMVEDTFSRDHPVFTKLPGLISARMLEAGFNPKIDLLASLDAGHLTVMGVYPSLSLTPVPLDWDTVSRGQLDVMGESLSDYRTNHTQRYWSLRLVPTKKGLADYKTPPFDRSAAFAAAIEVVGCKVDNKTRVILGSKRAVYQFLEEQHPGRFGAYDTFSRNYARSGEWAQDLKFPIIWMSDNSEQ